jgi:hypothetical protein
MATGQGAAQILAFGNGEDRRVMARFCGNPGGGEAGLKAFGGFGHQASCRGRHLLVGPRPDITRK